MKEKVSKLMTDVEFCESVSEEIVIVVEEKLNINFPKDYREFVLESNGVAGAIGDNAYLIIWPIEELVDLNEGYGVEKFTPGLVYFGSDGGGMAYAFDVRKEQMKIVEIPFESIHIEDANVIADTFEDFLNVIYKR